MKNLNSFIILYNVMKNGSSKIEQRIRNIERFLISICILILSIIYLTTTSDLQIENYKEIIVSVFFFISFTMSFNYFLNLITSFAEDISIQTSNFIKSHKATIDKFNKTIKLPLIVILGILAIRYLFEFEWKLIFGSLTLIVVGSVITNWLKNYFGKKQEQLKEKYDLLDDKDVLEK